MLAVVLSCDRYHCVARHMIGRYALVWPNHPFEFLVPYQAEPFPESAGIRARRTPLSVKETVFTLLDGLDDEQWVYWCMDDKFPVAMDVAVVRRIHEWLESGQAGAVSGVLFCRGREMIGRGKAAGAAAFRQGRMGFHERHDYSHIWLHQYVRVKVLRHLFMSFPGEARGKVLDSLKKQVAKPATHSLYCTSSDAAMFCESVSGGKMNARCKRSMDSMGLEIPAWFQGELSSKGLIGDMGWLSRLKLAAADLRGRTAGAGIP